MDNVEIVADDLAAAIDSFASSAIEPEVRALKQLEPFRRR